MQRQIKELELEMRGRHRRRDNTTALRVVTLEAFPAKVVLVYQEIGRISIEKTAQGCREGKDEDILAPLSMP